MSGRVVLVRNTDDQAQFADWPLPSGARTVLRAMDVAGGWEVRTGWSVVAIPAGWRESSRHKAVASASLVHHFGVQGRNLVLDVQARFFWTRVAPDGRFAPDGGLVGTYHQTVRTIGYAALVACLRGDRPWPLGLGVDST